MAECGISRETARRALGDLPARRRDRHAYQDLGFCQHGNGLVSSRRFPQ